VQVDEDLELLRALEARDADAGPKTAAERKHKERRRERLFRDADLYNHLAGQHGSELLDRLIAEGWTAAAFRAAELQLLDDLDLWLEATGERRTWLREAEQRGLRAWLWETHDRRRQAGRHKPRKSSKHDQPWPGAADWAPRRWFREDIIKALRKLFPGLPLRPLTISVSRALNRERAQARAKLATEVHGSWEDGKHSESPSSIEPLAERNHPAPQGYWWTKAPNGIRPDRLIQLLWPNYPAPKWERCEDELPPQSVLDRTHVAPESSEDLVDWNLQRWIDRLDRWQLRTGKRVSEYPRRRYPPQPAKLRRMARTLPLPDADDLDRLATTAALEAA